MKKRFEALAQRDYATSLSEVKQRVLHVCPAARFSHSM